MQSDPDTPNFHQAMAGEHAEEIQKAMDSELEVLVERKAWNLVP